MVRVLIRGPFGFSQSPGPTRVSENVHRSAIHQTGPASNRTQSELTFLRVPVLSYQRSAQSDIEIILLPCQTTGRKLRGPVFHLDHFDQNREGSRLDCAKMLSRGIRKVNDAAFDERAAVVDHHLHLTSVLRVGDTDYGPQRQEPVRRGHLELVVDHPTRSGAAVKVAAVPGRDTLLRMPGIIASQPFRNRHAGRQRQDRKHQNTLCYWISYAHFLL